MRIICNGRDAAKIKKAIKIYYSKFGTEEAEPLSQAAYMAGTDSGSVHLYIIRNKLPMPATRRDALRGLEALKDIK